MSLLHHEGLKEVLSAPLVQRLIVTPLLDPRQVGGASIDLRLGTEFLLLKRTERAGLDPGDPRISDEITAIHERMVVPLGTRLWLHPGQFLLGSTLEFVRMPDALAGFLVGRSSWARLGLVVETAGLVQPGYAGTLTYELSNSGDSPIALYPGLRVAQLVVYRLPSESGYRGLPDQEKFETKYLSAVGPEASRVAWEEGELKRVLHLGRSLAESPKSPSVEGSD